MSRLRYQEAQQTPVASFNYLVHDGGDTLSDDPALGALTMQLPTAEDAMSRDEGRRSFPAISFVQVVGRKGDTGNGSSN
jgi:hypothetical protein